ncbi:hypothetical protein Salat_2894400 [Sesamum alatum]|uniref:Transposase n=1 Tax=Sesamum alatum TaxID=300844 RepID=A0AAE2C819_9LAMI|nr:hypothetical protein Salat_2894400 [Sesamum alatum]
MIVSHFSTEFSVQKTATPPFKLSYSSAIFDSFSSTTIVRSQFLWFSSSNSFHLTSMSTRNQTRVRVLDRALGSEDINDQAQVQVDPREQPTELTNLEQVDTASSVKSNKKGRGITKGISVEKKRRKMEKLEVTIHPRRRRVVGENAKDFKTEACVVLKQHAPLRYARWKDIPIDSKKKMWLAMKQKFNLQDSFEVQKIVFEQLNRQYRSYRHKLHVYYFGKKDEEEILHKPPNGVSEEHWEKLINYFESDGFQKISDRNKENRKKLKMAHICGTKSIVQYCYEDRDPETEQEPTRTATWRKTRYSNKKNGWVDQTSEAVYEDITRLQSQASEAGQEPITEDEAFIKVLGPEKSSRLRGCGDGLKPPSKRGGMINDELIKENEELRKQAEEDRECLESLKKDNKEMYERLRTLESQVNTQEVQVQSQVQAILKSQLPTIIKNLSIFGQIHPPANVNYS